MVGRNESQIPATLADKLLEWILAFVMVGMALAFGGVQTITYSLMEVILFFAVLTLLLKQTWEGKIDLRLPVWPLLFSLLVIVQTIPLPSGLIGFLSPTRLLDFALGGPSHGARAWETLSVYPHGTMQALLKFLAYLTGFLLAVYLFDSGRRSSNLVRGLMFLGCFEAGYGIIQYLLHWDKIFTFTKQYDTGMATGTYINHNHFAGLLELTIPFVVGSAFYSFQGSSGRPQTGFGRVHSRRQSSARFRSIFYLFLVVVMVLAVIFSTSRTGVLVTVFSILFIAMLAQLKTTRTSWMVGVFMFLVCTAGYGLWVGLNPILSRFEAMRNPAYFKLEGRISLWKDSLRLARDYPLVGTGLGTFRFCFPRYQTVLVNLYVDHAHNDYVEFAADTGIVGATLLFLPVLYLFGRMVVSFLRDRRRYRNAVILGCIGSTLGLILHSLMDFNLQIPANALIFAVVLGIGYKAACIERREEGQVVIRAGEAAVDSHPPSGGV